VKKVENPYLELA